MIIILWLGEFNISVVGKQSVVLCECFVFDEYSNNQILLLIRLFHQQFNLVINL